MSCDGAQAHTFGAFNTFFRGDLDLLTNFALISDVLTLHHLEKGRPGGLDVRYHLSH